ncbi:MAG: GNAT family N-acetyltransferase, partial [Bacteroidales bacterium]
NKYLRTKGVLVDEKITFFKKFQKNDTVIDNNIIDFEESFPDSEMIQLSIDSGVFSRYKIDKNFERKKFEEFFTLWIVNSVNKTFADKVFVYKKNRKTLGLVTVKIKNKLGNIGIIAVNSETRGLGIGSKLIQKVQEYLLINSINELEVVTQKANNMACKFYIKNGFTINNIVNIYHVWNNN